MEHLQKTIEMEPNEPTAHAVLAGVYAEAGKTDEALTWLEKAVEARDPHVIFVQSRGMSPTLPWKTSWYHLQSDPRFETILKKVGLENIE